MCSSAKEWCWLCWEREQRQKDFLNISRLGECNFLWGFENKILPVNQWSQRRGTILPQLNSSTSGHGCSRLNRIRLYPMFPFACLSSLMGCGISKLDIAEEAEASVHCQSRPAHRRNARAVVDSSLLSKPLPGDGGGEEHAKGDIQRLNIKKVNSEDEKEACEKEDSEDGDDSNSYLRSPSFKVYCVLPQSDDGNSEGDCDLGKVREKRQENVKNDKKKSSTRWGKRGRKGKGIKTGSAKVRSVLRV